MGKMVIARLGQPLHDPPERFCNPDQGLRSIQLRGTPFPFASSTKSVGTFAERGAIRGEAQRPLPEYDGSKPMVLSYRARSAH
jgi:hypothetical protein